MRLRRRLGLSCLVVLCATGVCLGLTYRWVGAGADDDWDTDINWFAKVYPSTYPHTTSDDAIILYNASGYTVDLVTVEINSMKIEGDATFGAVSGTPRLTLDTLVIENQSHDIVVELSADSAIYVR